MRAKSGDRAGDVLFDGGGLAAAGKLTQSRGDAEEDAKGGQGSGGSRIRRMSSWTEIHGLDSHREDVVESLEAFAVCSLLALLPAAITSFLLKSRWVFLFAFFGVLVGHFLAPSVTADFDHGTTSRDLILSDVAIDLPYVASSAMFFGLIGWCLDPRPDKRWPFKRESKKPQWMAEIENRRVRLI